MNAYKRRPLRAFLAAATIATILLTAACGANPDAGSGDPDDDPIQIGAVLSLSGAVATLGQATERGIRLAVTEVNDAGGIDGRPLEVTYLDDQSDQDVAASSAQRLMNRDGVTAMIGGTFGTTANAIGVLAERSEIPFVTSTGVVVEEQEGWEQSFFTLANFELVSEAMLQYLADEGHERIGLLRLSREYGQIGSGYLNELADDFGVEIVAEEQGTDADTTFTTQLTNIRAADVDAVIVWFANPAGATALRNMQELGIDVPVVVPLSMATGSLIDVGGPAAEDVVVLAQLAADEPEERAQAFVDLFIEEYGDSPETFDAIGYDLIMILTEAMRQADDPSDSAQVRDALESLKYSGAGTVVAYGPGNHQPAAESIVLTRVEDGKFVQLAN